MRVVFTNWRGARVDMPLDEYLRSNISNPVSLATAVAGILTKLVEKKLMTLAEAELLCGQTGVKGELKG